MVYIIASPGANDILHYVVDLTRISHQLTAADAEMPIFAALNTARVLDVPTGKPARPDSRSPCEYRHLRALARNLVRNAG